MFTDASGNPLPADKFRDSTGAIRSMVETTPLFVGPPAPAGPRPSQPQGVTASASVPGMVYANQFTPYIPGQAVVEGTYPSDYNASWGPQPPGIFQSIGSAITSAASFVAKQPSGFDYSKQPQLNVAQQPSNSFDVSTPTFSGVSKITTDVSASPNAWSNVLQSGGRSGWKAVILDGQHAFRNKNGQFKVGETLNGLRGMTLSGLGLAAVTGKLATKTLPVEVYTSKSSWGTLGLVGGGVVAMGLLGLLIYKFSKGGRR